MQFLKSYHVQHATWPWASLQGSLTLSYTESSKRLQRDQHKTWLKFWCGKNTWYMQLLRSYCIHKSFDFGLYCKFKKITQSSKSNLAEIPMRTSLPVKLQHDAGTFWGIIIFTRNCKMLQFKHGIFQKSKRSAKGQHRICPRFWCGKYLCKVTKWCMQFLRSYCVHKATWPWASLKVQKGYTKVIIELFQYADVKITPIKLEHHTSNTWEVIAITRQLDLELVLKVQKGHTKINIKLIQDFDVENTNLKLQLDTCNLWRDAVH